MINKKLEKLRASLTRLEGIHHGLKIQVDTAQSGGRCLQNPNLTELKRKKLACKDDIEAVKREINSLEASARTPKLVYEGEPPAGVPLTATIPETRMAARA